MSHSFRNIPSALQFYRQWIVWQYEEIEGALKPTKVPYSPAFSGKASVTNPNTWGTFEEAIEAFERGGWSGIGFVLTKDDPFCFIDYDDTKGDEALTAWHQNVHNTLDSYSEWSPSGTGVHSIVKATVQRGRRKNSLEVYCDVRFMTMTGNVLNNAPIAERQEMIDELIEHLGGNNEVIELMSDQPQREDDNSVMEKMFNAANGVKAKDLFDGDWQKYYPQQVGASEADFGLIDIIAYFSQNRGQIKRIFSYSIMGQREKYSQRPHLVDHMINRAFDRLLPEVNIEVIQENLRALQAEAAAKAEEANEASPDGRNDDAPAHDRPGGQYADDKAMPTLGPVVERKSTIQNPPGLVGMLAEYFYSVSPRPVHEISFAGAIGYFAGVVGRSYNVSGTGLNQYIMCLAPTGTGKEAINRGISKITNALNALSNGSDPATKYIGPGEIRSDAGLFKWLAKNPSFVSVLGEFGLRLKRMKEDGGMPHENAIKEMLLKLYSQSGEGEVMQAVAYSDKEKTQAPVTSPNFTLIGESTPERFYQALDEGMVYEGLLPRFTMFEYNGPRPRLSEKHTYAQPDAKLLDGMMQLMTQLAVMEQTKSIINIELSVEGVALMKRFDRYCDDLQNAKNAKELQKGIWSRAYLKALKLAGTVAVGINFVSPLIDADCAQWACDLVVRDCENIIGKFERGEVGFGAAGGENQQLQDMIKVIAEWLREAPELCMKYGMPIEMHRDGIILASALTKRLIAMASFRNDRSGSTNAIKRTLAILLEGDELREIPKNQMKDRYGVMPRAFAIGRPATFV
jgi:hypothetical protein